MPIAKNANMKFKRGVNYTDDKHICHLTSVHGAFDTRIFHKECISLCEAGYKVSLVAPHTRDECIQGVEVFALQPAANRLARMSLRTMHVFRLAKRIDADLYHFHDPELIPAALALSMAGRKVIYDIHEDSPRAVLSPGHHYIPVCSKKLISQLLEKLENFAASRFSVCITATPHLEERFKKIQTNTHTVNNYPLNNELFVKNPIEWKERQNAVSYVGNIAMSRGLREMVLAMGKLPEQLNTRLWLAGCYSPVSCRNDVLDLIGWHRVNELGFLNRVEIKLLLSKVKAGLVLIHPEPRYMVSQPTKLYEFLSAGIPVIASNFPLWKDLIERERCGLVVDPLDPRAIANAIEYILSHDIEAEKMGQRGRKAIEQRYNWSIEAKKLITVYKGVLSEN